MSGVKSFFFGENGEPLPPDVIFEKEQNLLKQDPAFEPWLDIMTKPKQEQNHENRHNEDQ